MTVMDFLINNWSQITVMLAALGYIVKIFLDYFIKKKELKLQYNYKEKEIRFQYVYKEKSAAFKQYLITYRALCDGIYKYSADLLFGLKNYDAFQAETQKLLNTVTERLYETYLFCSADEKENLYKIVRLSYNLSENLNPLKEANI